MMHSKRSGNKPKPRVFSFEAIGTQWSIEYAGGNVDVETAVRQRIELFDKTYSRFRRDSLITRIAEKAGVYELPSDAKPLLDFYAELYRHTAGAVSPLVGDTLSDAGYDASYSLRFKKKTIAPPLEDTLIMTESTLVVRAPVLIDVGAAGKGYLVDIICELLSDRGVYWGAVNAGGDVRVFSQGDESVAIALEHPEDRTQAVGVAHISNRSLCGSATTMRQWGNHHHIIDPRTAESPTHIVAVWVVADSAMFADGMATALFFADPEQLKRSFDFEYAIIRKDYSLERSREFPAHFFVEEGGRQ